ncbi:predicted protein [Naegleria gruberi]|uniref:Predicted protein n=1 Tax=Naegleria gruberi TaxID=5762 RepID=D2W630_NAEGR|nr:uncharacterized protein NAEGRDRAFT_54896 [Naegleria gruberi]EFC35472.1 predicted protein [Naegleria gruberi]|eukprot:XP_002668216.1 predicted protein [Naegleria gruberi strain NEG-M]
MQYFWISVDARYSSRRNVYECTLVVFETKAKKTIERSHVIKKRASNRKSALQWFMGASKLMEPEACRLAITSLKHKSFPVMGYGILHFKIGSFVHDKDSTVAAVIKKLEPTALEKLDPNHVIKNLSKEVEEKAPRIASIIVSSFRKALKLANTTTNSNEKLQALLKAYPQHLQNNHSLCDSGCPHTIKPEKLITKEEAQVVKEIFDKRIKYSHKFCDIACNSQNNESIHSTICHTTPKTLDFSRNYCGRADLAIGERLLGKFAQLRKIQRFIGSLFVIPKEQAIKLDTQYHQDKIRKQSKAYKERRVELRKTKLKFKLKGMEFVSSLIVGAHVSIQFWMDTHEESYSSEVSKTVEKYCAETNHHHDQILKSI